MPIIGYAYVQERLGLRVLPVTAPAVIRSVSRMERLPNELAVPAKRAPGPDVIEHLLFALKHEGIHLEFLARLFAQLPADELDRWIASEPTGQYARRAALHPHD